MLTHRAEHAQREIRSPSQENVKIVFRYKQNSCRLRCARVGRITCFGCERCFGERFDRAKQVNHLFLPGGAHAMNIDGPLLDNVKTFAPITLAKKIIAFVEMLRNCERGYRSDVRRWESHEELTTAERVFNDRLPELARFQRHAGMLCCLPQIVAPKSAIYFFAQQKSAAALGGGTPDSITEGLARTSARLLRS